MAFRPNGKWTSRRIAGALALAIAVSTVVVAVPTLQAQAATVHPLGAVSESSLHRVPKVVGWSASSAVTALKARGFGYRFKPPKGHKVVHPSKWTVIKQFPRAKKSEKPGTKITLTVISTRAYAAKQVRSFYSDNYKSFKTISASGTGASILTFPTGITSAIVTSSFSGEGSFTVTELSAGNVATNRVLVRAATTYSGATAVGLMAEKAKTTAVRVSGSGTWKVSIAAISTAPILSMPAKGTGDHVYLYSGASAMWTVSSPGPTTFILNQISSSSYPNLAVNESGNFAGPVAIQPGPSVIEIHSNGAWTIK